MTPVDPASPLKLPRASGPFGWLVNLFSSITFGIVLLSLLFVYSSIGSAGILYPTSFDITSWDNWAQISVRQLRGFEMTEFEWFHWWPFDLLIGLICVNLSVATLRRIPFRVVNYGVWMIHSGIIILALGSVWYFGTKFEGDSPVIRRQVRIEVPGAEAVSMPAVPGNRTVVQGSTGRYGFQVTNIDPKWSLRSGADEGKVAYSVQVSVQTPTEHFVRQLLVGYPEYTEDVVRVPGAMPPMVRAIKHLGRPLVDEELKLALEYEPQQYVYLANWISKNWALYLRERGTSEWSMRPVDGLPLFNDSIGSYDDVWIDHDLPLDPVSIDVSSVEQSDPLAGTDVRITGYLRYATMQRRRIPGGERLNPAATIRLRDPNGRSQDFELAAFDPAGFSAEGGSLQLRWVDSVAARTKLTRPVEPLLTLRVPESEVDLEIPLTPRMRLEPSTEFTPIEGTPYAYLVEYWMDDFEVTPGMPLISLASVRLRTPEREFQRWVCDDPRFNRDMEANEDEDHSGHDHEQNPHDPHEMVGERQRTVPTFEGIEALYRKGFAPAPLTLVAGPGEDELHFISLAMPAGSEDLGPTVETRHVKIGEEVAVSGLTATVTSFAARARIEERPFVVPLERRYRDAREQNSMVKVGVQGAAQSVWVPYHHYAFRDANEDLRRHFYRPATVRLPDGRVLDMILSRERLPLPMAVALDDFDVDTHIGGFSGRVSSILNWTSHVRFADGDGWSESTPVSVNEPHNHEGLWFFQAQWDPPSGARFEGDAPSAGFNYTVLGVTNRHGVGVQLLGCCIAVLGMIYAFYVKPLIRLRRRKAAELQLAGGSPGPGALGDLAGDQA